MKSLFPLIFLLSLTPLSAQLTPPNEAGITMGHVHLNVKDVDVQKKFWTEQFGAVPLINERPQLPGVKVPGMLIFFTKRDPIHGTEGTSLDHFGFRVHSLPDMEKSLRAAGYDVGKDFKGTEGFQNTYVMGPDNVKIELQEDVNLPVRAAVNHLHYMVTDPMALRDWYIEKLSLTATERGSFKTANAGGNNLTFGKSRTPPTSGTKGGSLDHIGFEVKNLEAYCKQLEAKGIKLDVPYRKVPSLGVAIAFITDPQGVYIELVEGLGAF
ncbi:MAG TPA: VOC family protein [Bryobacteraceae bacterium]|jgi:catechol 2,3-dioxygenase-like lactoylglutathione lyase family enzyme|nr:VOC family protein [Bryobacteraceae bacterium]